MTARPRIPTAVWALGFVSLLMDVSSELVHSLLPVFLVTALGASALIVGLIEGTAEATALIVKVFSGVLSDYWGRRKPLAVLGYSLGALSKPLFALATGSAEPYLPTQIVQLCLRHNPLESGSQSAKFFTFHPGPLRNRCVGARNSAGPRMELKQGSLMPS
jgi:MFS family permease